VTLKALTWYAYDVEKFQVLGGPVWIESEHYDVEAKAESDSPLPQIRLMVQRLLSEQFALTKNAQRDQGNAGLRARRHQ
jgi:uncharacterized protein (TIGR03435 family)